MDIDTSIDIDTDTDVDTCIFSWYAPPLSRFISGSVTASKSHLLWREVNA